MRAPDGELLRVIAGRSEDGRAAEAELCRRFAPRIRLYGLRHLRDEDRAADLVQAVLVAVLEAARAGRVDDPDRVDRFMLGTCRNVALRMREREERYAGEGVAEDVADDVLASLAAPDAAPDAATGAAWERIDAGALVRCLAALEDRARQVVMLSFNDEHPADEIARRLSLSAGNVRVLRHRALASLRRCLDAPKGRA